MRETPIKNDMIPSLSSGLGRSRDSAPTMQRTLSDNAKGPENITAPTEKNTPAAQGQDTSLQSSETLQDGSDLVKSTSMNLIDSSAEHMFALMKGLHANQPEPEIKSYDPDRVRAACACSDQIAKLMRLKLDVVEVGVKIKRNGKKQ